MIGASNAIQPPRPIRPFQSTGPPRPAARAIAATARPALSAGKITTMIAISERRNAPAQTSSATHTWQPMAAETGKIQTIGTRNMQAFRALPVLALAVALGLGMTANAALAPQMSSSSDHSSSAGQSVSDGLVTTRVKSERATTKGVKDMDVTASIADGVVMLTGVLATKRDARKPIVATKSVEGVKDVDGSGLKAED